MTCSTCGKTHDGHAVEDRNGGVVVSSTCEQCTKDRRKEASSASSHGAVRPPPIKGVRAKHVPK
jgi:hypothetical protein